MGLKELQHQEGQTPIDEDEKDGLLLPSVTTRSELDEVEQRNIEEAMRWTTERRRRFTVAEILTEDFVRQLHQKMLGSASNTASYPSIALPTATGGIPVLSPTSLLRRYSGETFLPGGALT